jgi:hypothetical protein
VRKSYINRIFEHAIEEKSGIPTLLKKLKAAGFDAVVEVRIILKKDSTTGTTPEDVTESRGRENAPDEPSQADLNAAAEMGFSIADVKAVEAKGRETACDSVLADLREKASQLSPKARRWICSYTSHTFPALDIYVPSLEYFEDNDLWPEILKGVIEKLLTLPDSQRQLDILLSHMTRLRNK